MPPRGGGGGGSGGGVGGGGDGALFFAATLLLWAVAVAFEIAAEGRRELLAVAAGFVFFQGANWVIRFSLSRDPLFVNTSVSLLHSIITSASVVFVLVNQWVIRGLGKMFEHEQLFGGTWLGAYSALCFSCGYFAYDQLDMIRYRLYSGWIPAILVHHLILLVCFTLALYRKVTINYLILSLVCELHSIFLHVRKVRRMAGFRDSKSRMVKVEWALNWATFYIARLLCHILITYKLIIDAHKFDRGIELPLALFGMAGMNLLNIFLGLDLLKAYRRERNQQRNQE
ncbi:TLC domain-containing protein 2 [Ananas comosus]|uniref:TLC domain-containing protein 2 n=1 Tax=Ananas comosus TaxID=4615 RepID=A0A6P5GC61_ANACO|nr:TLC domain-containing protein 2 [Ananas comosus]